MTHSDSDRDTATHPAQTSDADPGGREETRRPGEGIFALLMLAMSLALLWSAFGISGFEALSSLGSVPMATTAVMVIATAIVAVRTWRLPRRADETFGRDILPWLIVVMAGLLVAYALLLRPLGFLPTSALFLTVSIKLLSRRSWGFTLAVALGSLAVIWLIFRIVFTVLMPSGIIPEAEFIQMLRSSLSGGTN